MANGKFFGTPPNGGAARPEYAVGDYLTAEQLSLEQQYRLHRFRRHNRRLHAWGVLCGMWVVTGDDPSHPWMVRVCPGYAIGPYGDEIEMPAAAPLNIADFLWSRPPDTATTGVIRNIVYVVVRYAEIPDALQPVPGEQCTCDEPVYDASRLLDGFELAATWTLRAAAGLQGVCRGESAPCPDCPDSPWLYLARIVLPASTGTLITAPAIDNGIRNSL